MSDFIPINIDLMGDDELVKSITSDIMADMLPMMLNRLMARLVKHNLTIDQYGVDHINLFIAEDDSVGDTIDNIIYFYGDVLDKEDPSAYMLYSDGVDDPFLVAKCVEDLL
jgi:hypothetical protein